MTSIYADSIVLPAVVRYDRTVANASNQHCTCFAVLGNGAGVLSQSESWGEMRTKLILNARPDVAEIREQILFKFGPDRDRNHWFDVVVIMTSGRVVACTYKPEAKVGRRAKNQMPGETFLTHMQEVAWWVQELGFADEVKLITDQDFDPIELHNAQIIAAVREEDPEAVALARSAVAGMLGQRTLQDLTLQIGQQARGYHGLLRLVRSGELVPQVGKRITPNVLVMRKGAIQ